MQVLKTIRITQQMMSLIRLQGQTIGFVPTMGSLHAGHMSLIEAAREECDVVVVSIFVNPTQFSKDEDLENYPRDIEQDKLLLERASVDYLFYPEVSEMYDGADATAFKLPEDLISWGCAPFRPGHFEGVAQVCAKLFNIITPNKVYFGQKDYQQTLVIDRLIKDLNFDIDLRVMPTVRERGGLAMSSRNKYLGKEDRKSAEVLYQALLAAVKTGSLEEGRHIVSLEPKVQLEYFEIHDGVALLAARIGDVRLIDNVVIE
ncbi:pantoate--beta-alanine ligase [Candidatus Peregrinibacteria bacterium CG22_combo_CG10-13_8_21_14_all_44_10]|nr:MAG: pantoate--beta-alanine ligase [Candidatus Peregrinibacteria bacterium CG2_30_44_17]PIP66487.1 MAG: pantoate--beta-alanine ligase [Candidatus Peregrinibacteria bacterium CG22_combo_CG10-13_8_21_14_all_44_10]PIS04498.1 MAG: pantoate--beta-alanine ligase [Candidatus Peregrinibacteria bacterium CG10_big_fil_rev_8_21_14_0_10_44_7]PIX79169.1 MAG: pantoate--beta-alanine ligase [Candidatus Peregrinibacteria bacterium CG_4_10_14_3_um_filter_44_21]PJB88424.1 MAG: pantoate--beta-alanine ligase [Ca